MKNYLVSLLLLIISLTSMAVHADSYDADRHQMKLMLEDIREKLNHKDQLTSIVPYFDKQAIITFYDARTVIGQDGLTGYINHMVTGPNPVLKNYKIQGSEAIPATIYPNNTAIAYGWIKNRFDFVTGDSIDVDGRWTATLLKENNTWKIITLHFSTNLWNNPLITALEHKIIFFVLVSLVIGIIVGYVFDRLFFRRRNAQRV